MPARCHLCRRRLARGGRNYTIHAPDCPMYVKSPEEVRRDTAEFNRRALQNVRLFPRHGEELWKIRPPIRNSLRPKSPPPDTRVDACS